MRLAERLKFVVYRTPVLDRIMTPKYPYKINPGELSAMVELIETTRGSGGAIAEIGVAQGDTSMFLLEHLRSVGDPRPLLLLDTFAGFTEESIEFEVSRRGKRSVDYDKFRYGDEARFRRHLTKAGYSAFRTIKGDAATFDWAGVGPLGAILLDIDLYQPTIKVLEAAYPLLVPGGGIVIDDCLADTPWDGSLQAYTEFITAHDLPFERVGQKGAVVRKP